MITKCHACMNAKMALDDKLHALLLLSSLEGKSFLEDFKSSLLNAETRRKDMGASSLISECATRLS